MANRTWLGTSSGNWGTAGNWLEGAVPVAGDDVRIAPGTVSIDSGLDQSAVAAMASLRIEAGYRGTIGTSTANLKIKTEIFEFAGSGVSYIDLLSTAVTPQIFGTATPDTGYRGLYLIGTNFTNVNVLKGYVGLASRNGEAATATNVCCNGSGASLWVGAGTTLTNVDQLAGELRLRCAATTILQFGGTLTSEEIGAITTWKVYGGIAYPQSSGTITTVNLYGGLTDFTKSGIARTVTTLLQEAGSDLIYDPNVLTITNRSAPTSAVRSTVRTAA